MTENVVQLEKLYASNADLTGEELTLLLDGTGLPDETGWRTLYSFLFDSTLELTPSLKSPMARKRLEPIVRRALQILEKKDFRDTTFINLMRAYHVACFKVCHKQLREAVSEINHMTREFKTICLKRQGNLEQLEIGTLETVVSDLDPEEMVARIRTEFRAIIDSFKADYIKLDRMSNTDHLTGLYNRRFFDEQLGIEIAQAVAEKTWLSLLMIDIDDFKVFNDTYGHVVGDQALKIVAQKIRTECEKSQNEMGFECYPIRFGGEEFTVILPAVELSHAETMAEAIRETIASYRFVIRNKNGTITHKDIRITVSIGLARLNHAWNSNDPAQQLVRSADDAMYKAKLAGKNCVRTSQG